MCKPLAETGRHTDGSNYLAADGHVKWLQAVNVSGGYYEGSAGYVSHDCQTPTASSTLIDNTGHTYLLTFDPF